VLEVVAGSRTGLAVVLLLTAELPNDADVAVELDAESAVDLLSIARVDMSEGT
jgi:hypothetical protein